VRVLHPYGSKQRLFELMEKVGRAPICEQKLSVDEKYEIVRNFVSFAEEKLGLSGKKPTIKLISDPTYTQKHKSFASYDPETYLIIVVIINRNMADILRSLAHELVHHKQNIDGVLHFKSGETGSEHENEANAMAGALMREFGKMNPNIFE
jgi:Zn-dependent peptidase ImmA (M78 family)